MAKKAKPAVRASVQFASCTVYFSDRAVVCPVCGVTVPKATSHTCEKKSPKLKS